MRLHRVTGWVVRADHAAEVVTPPYDALDPAGRARFAAAHPDSYLGVLPEEVAPGREHDLGDARARLEELLAAAFEPLESPVLGLLELSEGDHRQLGVVGDLALGEGHIHVHEATRPARVRQMVRFLDTVGVASSPVAVALDDRTDAGAAVVAAAATAAESTPPDLDFTTVDGLGIRLWLLDGDAGGSVQAALADVGEVAIVDGHHRSAAQRRHVGSDHLLAVVFPMSQLRIESFDRIVRPVPGGLSALPGRLRRHAAALEELPGPRRPARAGDVTVVTSAGSWRLTLPGRPADGAAGLDVTRLRRDVLGPALGVGELDDPVVTAVHVEDPAELADRAGDDGAAFALHPVAPATLLAIAAGGDVMPPKSTYVTPKVRSGLLVVRR